jgi:outer membrane protein TolC
MVLGLLYFTSLHIYAQDTVSISPDYIQAKVQDSNLQIKFAQHEFEAAQADYRQSNALFLPNISASYTAMLTTNPLMAFGSKLNQEILTPNDFNPALLNDPDRIDNYGTLIEVQQPLLNLDGLYERQAARSKMHAYQLRAERTAEHLALEAEKAYMQLQMAWKAVDVVAKALKTAEANLVLVEDYYEQGLLQRIDVLEVEVRVNEVQNQLQTAKSQVENASDYLSFLLDEAGQAQVYRPETALAPNEIEVSLIAEVPVLRKDIQAMGKSAEAYEKMLNANKMQFLPRINAFGNYQIYDGEALGFGANGYLIGASLSWSLFDGYASIGQVQKSRVVYEKALTEVSQYSSQSQLELNQALHQLENASRQLTTSRLALEQAEEAYRIQRERFKEGLVKTTDLLMAETRMFQKELEYHQCIFNSNFTQKYVHFLTH